MVITEKNNRIRGTPITFITVNYLYYTYFIDTHVVKGAVLVHDHVTPPIAYMLLCTRGDGNRNSVRWPSSAQTVNS